MDVVRYLTASIFTLRKMIQRNEGVNVNMYELIQVGEKSYYINCPAKIGIYKANEDGVYLIDSGSDKDAGRKVRQILDKNGWKLLGILSTHSNADHIGGNKYLQSQTGCKIFTYGIEGAITKYPVLEPAYLYGGYPCKDLRHKFLMAQESEVVDVSDEDFPKEVEVIPLPGHFFDMVGYRIPDGTVFVADCVSSKATLEKYAVSVIYDVEAYLKTLDMVENMDVNVFVPSHADTCTDMKELAECNRQKVYEIENLIWEICSEKQTFDVILQKVFTHYELVMTFQQHVLVGSTIRSYLAWMKDQGKLDIVFEDNLMKWIRKM